MKNLTITSILATVLFSITTTSCYKMELDDDSGAKSDQLALIDLSIVTPSGYSSSQSKAAVGPSTVAQPAFATGLSSPVHSAFAALPSAPALVDSNLFILNLSSSEGDIIYSGTYGGRPDPLLLHEGSYLLEIHSINFEVPTFDAPCYSHKLSFIVEGGDNLKLPLLLTLSNSALRLKFSNQFKERFNSYSLIVEDRVGSVGYPYNEERFLYLNSGLLFLKMEGPSDSFLLGSRILNSGEVLTLSLHSSVGGDVTPGDGSSLYTEIEVDTTKVWLNEELTIGERRDGTASELAIRVEELPYFIGHKEVWVEGYVVGVLTTGSLLYEPPFSVATNIAIASDPNVEERSLTAGIALTSGSVRESLNLVDNPEILGKKIKIKGNVVESYYSLIGVNTIKEFIITP